MDWLERKYINLYSNNVRNFKWRNNTANCSCPVCGDSKKDKTKARFFFLMRNERYHVFCHNCGFSMKFTSFLKKYNNVLYEQLVMEQAAKPAAQAPKKAPLPVKKLITTNNVTLKGLKTISQLPVDHPARMYCNARKIPVNKHYKLFYTDDFMGWTNSLIPNKFLKPFKEARLVIPFFDREHNMFAYQGRALGINNIRYITITLDDNIPKLYGLDDIDTTRKFYVVEGPLDSLFLPNCLAMAGSDAVHPILDNPHCVYVLDNQPRNKEIVKKLNKLITEKRQVCVWPSRLFEKDINDMILSGKTSDDIVKIINDNTYTGLEAQLHLQNWKKV